MAMNGPDTNDLIVGFYSGACPDHAGRTLDQILGWDDERLEEVHDYIQWLFPMEQPSPVNPSAPVVREGTRRAFKTSPLLRDNLCRACARMLAFYGLECDHDALSPDVVPGEDFADKSGHWMHPGNHNLLRLTRILTSLRLLGRSQCSKSIHACLSRLAAEHPTRIPTMTLRFWDSTQSAPEP